MAANNEVVLRKEKDSAVFQSGRRRSGLRRYFHWKSTQKEKSGIMDIVW